MKFNRYEKTIINVLYRAWRPLTTSQIAEKSGVVWITAKNYLNRLYNKGYLHTKKQGKSIYWWLKTQ